MLFATHKHAGFRFLQNLNLTIWLKFRRYATSLKNFYFFVFDKMGEMKMLLVVAYRIKNQT